VTAAGEPDLDLIPEPVRRLIDEATPPGHPGRAAMIRDLSTFYARGGWREHLRTAVAHILREATERPADRAA
jgi:hypothetical protein